MDRLKDIDRELREEIELIEKLYNSIKCEYCFNKPTHVLIKGIHNLYYRDYMICSKCCEQIKTQHNDPFVIGTYRKVLKE